MAEKPEPTNFQEPTVPSTPDAEREARLKEAIARVRVGFELFDAAKKDVEAIKEERYRSPVLMNIIGAEVKAGLFDRAKADARMLTDAYQQARAFSNIVIAEAEDGLFDKAKTDMKLIEDAHLRVIAFEKIIIAEARAGLFDQAEVDALSIEEGDNRLAALSGLAEARTEVAIAHFKEAKESIRDLSDEELNKLLADVSETYASRIRTMHAALSKKKSA